MNWSGFAEAVGWLYPNRRWTEQQLHAAFIGARLLPGDGQAAAQLGPWKERVVSASVGGSTVGDLKVLCRYDACGFNRPF